MPSANDNRFYSALQPGVGKKQKIPIQRVLFIKSWNRKLFQSFAMENKKECFVLDKYRLSQFSSSWSLMNTTQLFSQENTELDESGLSNYPDHSECISTAETFTRCFFPYFSQIPICKYANSICPWVESQSYSQLGNPVDLLLTRPL
jgi:hypothetical protein